MTLGDFRNAIESRSMPGCGAAAAASAGIGLALVLKGLRLTEAKHADEDVAAFNDYLTGLKQPHADDAQAAARNQALAAATERINRVPLDTARACLDGLTLSRRAVALTADHLHSDSGAGAQLLHAGLSAVLLNVDANRSGLREARERERLGRIRRKLQDEADRALEGLQV